MQFHCLVEPKLERESVVNIPSSCSSLMEVFYIILNFKGGRRMDVSGSSMDGEVDNIRSYIELRMKRLMSILLTV